ncbi:diguanylate cyclase [Alteromonas sp. 1_MG-2023]|uniref:tetratricopeptide repeat-containing diguanylate cyclase n=1 Tax=Alteromonas sp. 1_MG-2023 TaxID=3062669 RepID=UPI0026E32170|nr:GGDEF domain-containing protein [Alteromonas sp. 1_MG-2023]MDO6568337.1 diguanylate cyclase [Alteromonas sp. 1_MG-2023]
MHSRKETSIMPRQSARLFANSIVIFSLLWTLVSYSASAETSSSTLTETVQKFLQTGAVEDAERHTLLAIEQAHQYGILSASTFFDVGVLLQNASRFNVANDALYVALDGYTRHGQLVEMANTLHHLGTAQRFLGNYDQSIGYLRRAQSIAQTQNIVSLNAKIQMELGLVQMAQGQVQAALYTLKKALNLFRAQRDTKSTAEGLATIGDIFVTLGQLSEANTYYQDALQIAKSNNDKALEAETLGKFGALLLLEGKTTEASKTLKQAISLLKAQGITSEISTTQAWLGEALVKTGETQEGLALLEGSLAFAKSTGRKKLLQQSRLALANAMLSLQQFDDALAYAKNGIIDARQSTDLRSQMDFLSIQVKALAAKGEFKRALDIQSVLQSIKEEVLSSGSEVAIAQLQAGIEIERQAQSIQVLQKTKQLALAEAEQTNLRTTLFWSTLIAGLLTLFLVWSRLTQRQQNIRLRREVKQRTKELEQKNSELETAYKTLEQVSLHDSLTGLYNRHYLESQLPGELKRSSHANKHQQGNNERNQDLLCFLVDIDHFKRINDEHGHLAGDKVLSQFADVLRDVFRQTDLLIRWGGEEFLVICRHSMRDDLPQLAERCRTAVSENVFHIDGDKSLRVTCSIGFSILPPVEHLSFEESWKSTFAVVDYCLYATKMSGRNGWIGVIDTNRAHVGDAQQTPLDKKFHFKQSYISTSFNTLSSIHWPEE